MGSRPKKNQPIEIDLERDNDGIYKPAILPSRNPKASQVNVDRRNKNRARNKAIPGNAATGPANIFEVLVETTISQFERETRRLIRGLFR